MGDSLELDPAVAALEARMMAHDPLWVVDGVLSLLLPGFVLLLHDLDEIAVGRLSYGRSIVGARRMDERHHAQREANAHVPHGVAVGWRRCWRREFNLSMGRYRRTCALRGSSVHTVLQVRRAQPSGSAFRHTKD